MIQENFEYTLTPDDLINGVKGINTVEVDYVVYPNGGLCLYKIHLVPLLACVVKNWYVTNENIIAAAKKHFMKLKTAVEAAA